MWVLGDRPQRGSAVLIAPAVSGVRARAQPPQACLTLCGPKDCSLPGSSVRGILQTGVLEWASTPFPRGSSPPRDRTQVSCIAGAFFTSWTTREAPTSRVHATNATHHSWFNLEHMPRSCQPFPLCSYFPSLPPIRHCVGRSHYAQTTLKGWGIILHPPEVNYLSKSFAILLVWETCLLAPFMYSFKHLFINKLTGIYFQPHIIFQYYIIHFGAQIVLSVVFQLAPVSIWYTAITVYFSSTSFLKWQDISGRKDLVCWLICLFSHPSACKTQISPHAVTVGSFTWVPHSPQMPSFVWST